MDRSAFFVIFAGLLAAYVNAFPMKIDDPACEELYYAPTSTCESGMVDKLCNELKCSLYCNAAESFCKPAEPAVQPEAQPEARKLVHELKHFSVKNDDPAACKETYYAPTSTCETGMVDKLCNELKCDWYCKVAESFCGPAEPEAQPEAPSQARKLIHELKHFSVKNEDTDACEETYYAPTSTCETGMVDKLCNELKCSLYCKAAESYCKPAVQPDAQPEAPSETRRLVNDLKHSCKRNTDPESCGATYMDLAVTCENGMVDKLCNGEVKCEFYCEVAKDYCGTEGDSAGEPEATSETRRLISNLRHSCRKADDSDTCKATYYDLDVTCENGMVDKLCNGELKCPRYCDVAKGYCKDTAVPDVQPAAQPEARVLEARRLINELRNSPMKGTDPEECRTIYMDLDVTCENGMVEKLCNGEVKCEFYCEVAKDYCGTAEPEVQPAVQPEATSEARKLIHELRHYNPARRTPYANERSFPVKGVEPDGDACYDAYYDENVFMRDCDGLVDTLCNGELECPFFCFHAQNNCKAKAEAPSQTRRLINRLRHLVIGQI